jgi:toxoflavin biosynthesis protein ToxD
MVIDHQDAATYAAWLAQATGQMWRLPTEEEWEKAARGTDGRIYPWGNRWDVTRANTKDSEPKHTTPVGQYNDHGDASPYGAHEMVGNVSEWTGSIYQNQYNDCWVTRGGSWDGDAKYARAASRLRTVPQVLGTWIGMRLALSTVAEADDGR